MVDPEGLDSYVYYDADSYRRQAKRLRRKFRRKYKTKVHMIPVENAGDLNSGWKSMAASKRPIEGVDLLFHGRPGQMHKGHSLRLTATTARKNRLMGVDARRGQSVPTLSVGDLPKVSPLEIRLQTCYGATRATGEAMWVMEAFHTHMDAVSTSAWTGKMDYSLFGDPVPHTSASKEVHLYRPYGE
jgi:hypothetical protein